MLSILSWLPHLSAPAKHMPILTGVSIPALRVIHDFSILNILAHPLIWDYQKPPKFQV